MRPLPRTSAHLAPARVALIVALAGALAGALAASASATPPGTNGRIVFASGLDLYTVAPGGGPARALVVSRQDEANPSWSPDGQLVAFQRSVRGAVTLWVARADGTRARQLGDGADPAFSPDGTRIAFVAQTGRNYDVWAMNADGSERQRLTTAESAEFSPTWSPDGRRIAFARFDTSGAVKRSGIHWLKAVPGFRPQRVTTGVHDHPSWSPDGTTIAYDGFGERSFAIFATAVDGTTTRQLTGGGSGNTFPAWSPDGTRVAFVSSRGGESALFSVPAAGGEAKRLTKALPLVGAPDWGVTFAVAAAAAVVRGGAAPLSRASVQQVPRQGRPTSPH